MIKKVKSSEDYLLASRNVSPTAVGLSASSSTASGFAFTGVVGFGYTMGLPGIWIMLATFIGGYIAVKLVSRPFRTYTQRHKSSCYTGFITSGLTGAEAPVRILIALITITAVVLYAAAQLTAGSKALHVLFGWHYDAGAILGAAIVLMYCFAGGIRASIWTDVAQSFVMLAAMAAMLYACLHHVGGWSELMTQLAALDPAYDDFWPGNMKGGAATFIGGWLFLGISFIGFPHVMVRFMTLRKAKETNTAINWYFAMYAGFYTIAYLVAICTRVILPPDIIFDKELALLETAQIIAPFFLVGLLLAGVFASTISTADSLILSGTASISQDLFRKYKDSYIFLKGTTLAVTALSVGIAVFGSKDVFSLVLLSVSIMGSAFAPLVLLRAYNWPYTTPQVLLMILVALIIVAIWRHYEWHTVIYEALPGFVSAMLVYGFYRLGQNLVPQGKGATQS